ncbi:hypothetical protein [Gilliamella apicola]|uniref:hypothetical protein n=1 Tax=Gilliamella apicola TaxID=1196095 RepID=UPI0009FBE038|nr:hypothetical protein [Gilliamella apicola]ORF45146.1 hypothetical protein B5800_08860 [Gilliamella apicola]ORF48452.1 hypothetical protein B5799_08485 [Gilliamella apicola]ORF50618.1 hypothetical protein B5802_12630 [Gilliamella apicola]ORF52218.1 hypothetical protein B5803_05315 [Gilliamella apicola]ORF54819.1 hypothetical protein B5798_05510 [Gilliamella apicola]
MSYFYLKKLFYLDEDKEYSNYKFYNFKNREDGLVDEFIKRKLMDKGLSLMRLAIMKGGLNADQIRFRE